MAKPKNNPANTATTTEPIIPAAPEFAPETPALPNVDVAPVAPVAPPVPAEPAPPAEPVADVPRGTPEVTDDAAPYGRDAGGRPLAPYGYKADGVTPAKKRGRKGADPGVHAVDDPRGTPEGTTEKPKREKKSAVESALAALDSAKESGDGYWTVEADERRCERARRNQADFVDLAEIAIEMGEPVMLGLVRSSLLAKNPGKAAQIDAILARIKPMREVKFKFAGREISVLTGNAESLAFVLAYFSPWRPSHPLLRSAIQLLLSQRAYLAHVKEAANAALTASAQS